NHIEGEINARAVLHYPRPSAERAPRGRSHPSQACSSPRHGGDGDLAVGARMQRAVYSLPRAPRRCVAGGRRIQARRLSTRLGPHALCATRCRSPSGVDVGEPGARLTTTPPEPLLMLTIEVDSGLASAFVRAEQRLEAEREAYVHYA